MNAIKILLSVLILAGVAAVAWFSFGSDPIDLPTQPVDHPAEAPTPTAPKPIEPTVADRTPTPTPSTDRVAVDIHANSSPDAEQGVKGRVLTPSGGPAAGVSMILMQSTSADPLQLFLAHKTGRKILPAAIATTGPDGRFVIGIEEVDKTWDIRIVSDEFPEAQHKSIKVRAKDWYDTGDLHLEPGGLVQGHVVDETGKFPVANAQVYLTVPSLNHQMLPTPGRERGIVAVTDGTGFFRYSNAPRDGAITLGAEAPDYAYTEKANLVLNREATNDFTLELAHGEPIAGITVDQNGKPVAGVSIVATAQSAKLPQTANATSGSDGRFRLPMLRPGPYQLVGQVAGYEEVTEKPVFTNNLEVKLVLEQRGKVRLRVLSARGAPVFSYQVQLKRYFPNNPNSIGKVPEFREVRVTRADYDGEYASIRSVPNGDFMFQIIEANHAKTLSPPFTMDGTKEPPVVEVRLTTGASITGIVVDDRGQPVPDATVGTDMNGGIAADTGFFDVFKSFLPDKHTTKSVKTDGGGRFVINQLAYADYMLRISHPDFCEGVALDIKLENEGEMKDVGMVQLARGGLVEGVCTMAGSRAGQIKVTISPPDGYKPETDQNGAPKARYFSANAITDGEGHYRFLKRVPPGTYKIYAYKEAGSDDIFTRFRYMKESQRQLVIEMGQNHVQMNFDLPGQ